MALANKSTKSHRRSLGAYYTPSVVADLLCEWAIRRGDSLVLEPSFGGCEFLASIFRRLAALECEEPARHVYGADIDSAAFIALKDRGFAIKSSNFHQCDFLSLDGSNFKIAGVDVVIGNPPYVRHHALSKELKESARRVRDRNRVPIPMQANLWAFFVLHACSFLNECGRIALVLPQNFLHATYSEVIREFIGSHFKQVVAIRVQQQLFEHEGASERSVLLLADGYSRNAHAPVALSNYSARDIADVKAILDGSSEQFDTPTVIPAEGALRRSVRLGDVSQIRIGLVTGDANFFIFDKAKAERYDLGWTELRPFLWRADASCGLTIDSKRLIDLFDKGHKTAILDTGHSSVQALKKYLQSMPTEKRERNVTFKKRAIWHYPFDGCNPDAFFTSMSHKLPRVLVNSGQIDCSNSLYRINYTAPVSSEAIALSMVSTFGQLSAELEGRPYSSGLLKHEPSDASNIRVFSDLRDESLASSFSSVDRQLREGQFDAATMLSDRLLLKEGLYTEAELEEMKRLLRVIRSQRLKAAHQ